MNIAVINLKDIIKYALFFILILAVILVGIGFSKKEELSNIISEMVLSKFENSSFLYCLQLELPLVANEELNIKHIDSSPEAILNTQLAILNNVNYNEEIDDTEENMLVENIEYTEVEEENKDNIDENTVVEKIEIPENLKTEVISEHNLNARYTDLTNSVKINNQTSFDIKDINSNYNLINKNKVIIYHTHTCESYTSSESYNYQMTGTYRTTDLNYTVARVGDELEKYLTGYGKEVVHDKTYHDYPAYNGSYGRSLTTMESVLKKNTDSEIMIDLHRDAVGSSNTYGPTVKIGDEICAQVMFVMGSNRLRSVSSRMEKKYELCNDGTRKS